MHPLTATVELLGAPRDLPETFNRGTCLVAETSSPFPWGSATGLRCYAVLASWLPTEAPIGMYLTVHGDGEVHRLYADDELRGQTTADTPSVPKRVGRWMFEQGLFKSHSRDRNPAGDSWAEFVGGGRPAVSHVGPQDDSERTGTAVLTLLNRLPWSTVGPPGPPSGANDSACSSHGQIR